MNTDFVHVNLPKVTNDAIQRLLARAIEWRDEQELAELSTASGRGELSPTEVLDHLDEEGTRRINGLAMVEDEPVSNSLSLPSIA